MPPEADRLRRGGAKMQSRLPGHPKDLPSTGGGTDWSALAPAIALELLGQPDEQNWHHWHWKGRGGLYLNLTGKYAGQFRLWAAGESLGLVAMVEREKHLDRAGAIQWLTDAGHLTSPNALPACSALAMLVDSKYSR